MSKTSEILGAEAASLTAFATARSGPAEWQHGSSPARHGAACRSIGCRLRCRRCACGDWFDLHLGDGRKLSCRMELGRDWYIIVGRNDTKLYLKQNETYQVNI